MESFAICQSVTGNPAPKKAGDAPWLLIYARTAAPAEHQAATALSESDRVAYLRFCGGPANDGQPGDGGKTLEQRWSDSTVDQRVPLMV